MNGALLAVLIVLIVVGGITGSIVSYFTLQRHRADAVALAHYRAFAETAREQAVQRAEAEQEALAALDRRLSAIEELLRSVE
jgi:type II secretory pathway pseudopilin PulG